MDVPLTWADIKVFEPDIAEDIADALISGVWARARKLAPCLKSPETELDDTDSELLRSTLRSAVLRWHDQGSGAVASRSALDFSETLRSDRGGLFRPDEVRDLLEMCTNYRQDSATTIDTSGGWGAWPSAHPFLSGG